MKPDSPHFYFFCYICTQQSLNTNKVTYDQQDYQQIYLAIELAIDSQNDVFRRDCQELGKHQMTIHFCPYAMKRYNQRWYMVGLIQEQESIRTIAFDRIRTMDSTEEKFDILKTFSAKKLFADRIGIFLDDQAAPQKVILRAHGPSVDYLRSLPLHSSQEEIIKEYCKRF